MTPQTFLSETTRTLRAHILPLGCAAALVGGSSAQISFSAPTIVPTGQRVEAQILVDLDGDGDLDLAVTTEGTGNQDIVELFRNTAGTFAPAGNVNTGNGTSPTGLASADFDGDGVVDLAVTLKNVNQVRILRNLGGFSFSLGSSVGTSGSEPRQITAADMDGDGDRDLVISNRESSSVSVVRNAAGVLTLVGAFAMGSEARDNAVGDFDGDGDNDVAVSSHDSRQVAVLRNTGGGALSAPTFLNVPASTRPEGLAAADMDNDGDIDLVCGAGDDNSVSQNFVAIFRNSGGTFSGPFSFGTGGLDTADVFVADLDGDGDRDVVATNESSANMSVLANTGGNLGAATLIAVSGGQPGEIVGGDVDGNGSPDLALSLRQLANIQIFDNNAGGSGGVGTNYCTATVNSTGVAARIAGTGSASVAANNLGVVCTQMPLNSAGYFLTSTTQGFTANPGGSAGNLCLGGAIGRYSPQVMNSGATGSISLPIDLAALPTPTGPVAGVAGQTWNFQCWYRDAVGGNPTSNFSNGLAVTLN